MKQPHIIPALADLRQDIAGVVPVDLIKSWIESDRTPETHARLLKPYLRRGTLVKSDAAGLSKLTASRPLIEVLKLVNDPKELIAAHGLAIGGECIGTWIADDTEMFYPEHIPQSKVIDAMAAVQKANAENLVQIGIALHQGEFLHIGNNMLGDASEIVEQLAENETKGGELWICEPPTLVDHHSLVCTTQPLTHCKYPAPFSDDFLEELRAYTPEHAERLTKKYAHDVVLVLVRVFHAHQPLVMDYISSFVSANSDIARIASEYQVTKIKSNGQLGIFTAQNAEEAVRFAQAVRDSLVEREWTANVAVAAGPVFLFPLHDGATEIAGGPVNIASKLAEDTEDRDMVFVETSVSTSLHAHHTKNAQPFTVTRSGISLNGITL